MRFHVGPIPEDPSFSPEAEGWELLREPPTAHLMLMAIPLGVLLAVLVALGWSLLVPLDMPGGAFAVTITLPGLAISLVAVAVFVLAHEALHAVPALWAGSHSAVVVGFWPRYLAPYVAYLGALPRAAQLWCGVAPLLALTVLPVLVALAAPPAALWMAGISVLNTLGSAADLVMLALIVRQVPQGAMVRNQGHATWWRAAA